ncbi:S24 family peptidase [Aliiroseovarius lamellibrachiae]|uniref:S24 family peptidase n=1 Tax=Aliiroseovarius lamellibrachiae TaxID=1924933 RepID=UPI001BE0F0F4|nr:S24 family peptidase [Aliiroseovarius lamellibrachiae]MBT2131195.1 hypothetical protein [Aliiroseovarius lamellibrachiae]
MTQQEHFKNLVEKAVEALRSNAFAVEKAHGLPADAIRGVLRKKKDGAKEAGTSLNRAREICDALDLELYIGPPREIAPVTEASIDDKVFAMIERLEGHVAAGDGCINMDGDPIDHLAFTQEWLRRSGITAGSCFLISVKGDSMEPRISDGDLVMIDKRKRAIRNGKVYAFNDGDFGTRIKRLEVVPETVISLISDNPTYAKEHRTGDDMTTLADGVIGEVVWSSHKWG